MDYRNFSGTYYLRLDRDDLVVASIVELCRRENITSATYSGIGGCASATVSTFDPHDGSFADKTIEGTLELVSLMGNLVSDADGTPYTHTHALFTYVEDDRHLSLGGHLKDALVRYTAEIEVRPVTGGTIGRRFDPETGTGFWDFS